jgi:hypothetical protein
MSEGIIYLVRNKINNKIYIGKTTYSLEKRKREHLTWKIKSHVWRTQIWKN